jgi:hypothetical protein
MDAPSLFIALAVVFGLLIFALCLSGVRRFNLRRALGTVDASICMAGNSWQMGVCRYQDNDRVVIVADNAHLGGSATAGIR